MLFTDLIELKVALEIDPDDKSEDARLNIWLKAACDIIESYLGRPLYRQERTEYYGGSGTQKLSLRATPVWAAPAPQVWVDQGGNFGAASGAFPDTKKLTYGTDFTLWLDSDDGARSDRGILIRHGGHWNKVGVRQAGLLSPFIQENPGTIKVTYTGGRYAEDLPYDLVLAAIQATARIRFMMPLGLSVTGDSYEGRSVSIQGGDRNFILGQIKHLLGRYRRRRF